MIDRIEPTVRLSEPVSFPATYADTCKNFLQAFWDSRKWEMQELFGFHQLPILTLELERTMLAETLSIIARAADGKFDRADEGLAGEIYEHIQGLMENLFAVPGLTSTYTIPSSFWETPLGAMVARAFIWLRGDELITITEAAKLRGVTAQAISQAVEAGRLTRYSDPDAKQRQGRTLVSRREVEGMDK